MTMNDITKKIIKVWHLWICNINVPYLFISIIISLSIVFGAKYMARWSRSINNQTKHEANSYRKQLNYRAALNSCPQDVYSILKPYILSFYDNYQSPKIDVLINKYGYQFNGVKFRNTFDFLSWVRSNGMPNEELKILKNDLSLLCYRDYEDSYSYIKAYLESSYVPMIEDYLRRGDYYAAKASLDRFFEIYSLADNIPAFSSSFNEMFLAYALLQDRWKACVNRSCVDDIVDQIIDKERFKQYLYLSQDIENSFDYMQHYFNGLNNIRARRYNEGVKCFTNAYLCSTSPYFKELSTLMMIRCSVWKYDISHDIKDYQYAKNCIINHTNEITLPFFTSDRDGYKERLDTLLKYNQSL